MSRTHTDDFQDMLKEMDIYITDDQARFILSTQNLIQEETGIDGNWDCFKTYNPEDAANLYYDATDRAGIFSALDDLSQDEYNEFVFGDADAYVGEDELDEMFGGPNDAYQTGVYHYGAEFEGGKIIMEYEDDKIYIPDSYYCGLKCLAKAFNKDLNVFADIKGVNPFAMTPGKIYKIFKQLFPDVDESVMPRFYKWDDDDGTFKLTNSKMKSESAGCILAVRIQKNEYHAVYLKDSRHFHKTARPRVDMDYVRKNIKFVKVYDLDGDMAKHKNIDQFWFRTEDYIPKELKRDCIVYDIETYTELKPMKELKDFKNQKEYDEFKHKNLWRKKLIAYGVGWQYLDTGRSTFTNATVEEHEAMVKIHVGDNCVDDFIEAIVKFMKTIERDWNKEPMIIYAHNGGCFDHYYLKRSKKLKFISTIRKGGKIKCLVAEHIESKFKIKLLDSYNFTTKSLKDSCKAFSVPKEYCKVDFDIVDKLKQWYDDNNSLEKEVDAKYDWVKYLKYDIISLSYVIYNYSNLIMNLYNLNMNNVTGLPGLAWKLMIKNCSLLQQCYVCNSPINEKFIRASIKGGRVMHLKKEFVMNEDNKGMISLDATSLYPSAMELNPYPIGIPKSYNKPDIEDLHKWLANKKMFIAEIEYITGNQRIPFHPYKNSKDQKKFMRKDENGKLHALGNMLIYPQCDDEENPLVDVCTSVDIIEMLKDGYKILKVRRAIVWPETGKVFSPLIAKLYELRNKYKQEKNVAEQIVKLILNSMFGKTLELISEMTNFGDKDLEYEPKFEVKLKNKDITMVDHLENGQIEYSEKIRERGKKPSYLGSFILSYSKQMMNGYIKDVGIENIWYGDTDSFYTTVKALENSKIKMNDYLGGIKNDYGDGTIIERAIFVDYKRYYLEVRDKGELKIKAKFNGLCLTRRDGKLTFVTNVMDNETIVQLGKESTKKDYERQLKEFFEFFRDNPRKLNNLQCIQEKWIRTIKETRIDTKRFEFQVDPELRGQWFMNEWYPLGYKIGQEEKKYRIYNYEIPEPTKHIFVTERGMQHSLPFHAEYGCMSSIENIKQIAKNKCDVDLEYDDIINYEAFFITKNGTIIRNKKGVFYRIDNYGLKTLYTEKVEIDAILFALDIKGLDKKTHPYFAMCTTEIDRKEAHKKLYHIIQCMARRAKIAAISVVDSDSETEESKSESKIEFKIESEPKIEQKPENIVPKPVDFESLIKKDGIQQLADALDEFF